MNYCSMSLHEQLLDHLIKSVLLRFPVAQMLIKQGPELRAVVMVFQVSEFMHEHVVNARPRRFYEMRVQDDLAAWRAASPLPLHL